jgi:hypothetical protein
LWWFLDGVFICAANSAASVITFTGTICSQQMNTLSVIMMREADKAMVGLNQMSMTTPNAATLHLNLVQKSKTG